MGNVAIEKGGSMTLEEAKEKIREQAEKDWEEFEKTGSEMYKGFSLGADDALEILKEVNAKMTLKVLAREFRKLNNEEQSDFLTNLFIGQSFVDALDNKHDIGRAHVSERGEIVLWEV